MDGLSLTQAPLMDMGDMKHACPYTQPKGAGDGWYTSEVIYIMAGMWGGSATVTDGADTTEFSFPELDVAENGMEKTLTIGDETWVVTFNIQGEPIVGANPFVLTVHRMADMLSFPEIPGLSIEVEPTMPSMGHGSEGNINPVYTENGKYEGTVVFSMSGGWKVDFPIDNGAGVQTEATFDIEL